MSNDATHVLLIEDNPGDADLVRLRLVEAKSPVYVNCVDRLSDGLASLANKAPSVVLLDLNLPDSQGAETFRKVVQRAPDVPVVILSGQDDEALALKALHQGVQDYLVKGSITSGALDRAMRYAIERQALLRSLEISRKQQLEFKNQFLSHVSHELRTPLTCIHQFVTILLDGLAGEVPGEQRDHLQTILKSVNQLGAMVHDLLEASRVEAGKVRIEQYCVSIGELMRTAVAMMRSVAREKQVGLEIGVDTRIPFLLGDPDRILEVLINLLDNGIKFTPAGGAVTVIDMFKSRQITAMFTSLTSGDSSPEMSEVGVSSQMDSWLLLRNLECNGERNRGLYVLKSRGMAHSNQIREFLLTDHGVELRDVYVGASGLLTGSARVAQEARERAEAAERKRLLERKRDELKHKRAELETEIARMRSEFEVEELGLQRAASEMASGEKQIALDRIEMGRARKADAIETLGNGRG